MKVRLLLLFFLFSLYNLSRGATFVVTSNADSGPGTLREALTLANANGFATRDNIHFNLNGDSPAQRTITILSELPFLSSNLVLDATTQPGISLGISQAKVILKANRSTYLASEYRLGAFNLQDIKDIEIYGFCFDGFYDLKVKTNPNGQWTEGAAIFIMSGSDITIGAPNKGNVFMENGYAIYCSTNLQYENKNEKIKVQSNWFGLNTNGFEAGTWRTAHLRLIANDSDFGGSDLSYGNVLGGYSADGCLIVGNNNQIRFNRFGYNGDGSFQDQMIEINLSTTNSIMSDNLGNRLRITLDYCKDTKLIRNTELKTDLLTSVSGIAVNYSQNIQIGDDDLANANTFLPVQGTFYNLNSTNVEIRKNIIYCTPYAYFINSTVITTIQVLVNTDSEYSGIATPNSEVYIYNDYTDCTSCSPVQFYTKITADASGAWKIIGDFTNKKFIANATLIKSSSEFTQPQILSGSNGYWYNKKDPSCGLNNGMLELTRTLHLLRVEWYTINDVKVGEGIKIENLPAGRYYAKGFNGKCYTKTALVDLMNTEPTFYTSNMKVTQPGCGKNNGAIRGLFYYVIGQSSYKWVDEQNNILTTTNTNLINVGPGSYTLVATTISGCTKSYGPIILENTDGPNLVRTNEKIINATCGISDGSITGITATGTGTLQYSWKDQQGETIAQTLDLNNVSTGKYTLSIKDESTCDPISISLDVGEKNGITIDASSNAISKSTCLGNNGGISGMIVTGATTYQWINVQNQVVSNSLTLTGVPAGSYYLTASNLTCSRSSLPIKIDQQANLIDVGGTSKILVNATCGQNNGSIQVILQNPIIFPKSYRWENDKGETLLANGLLINNLDAGLYKVYGIDDNNCEVLLASYTLDLVPTMQLTETDLKIVNDKCSRNIGSISGLAVTGGIKPYQYKWLNEFGTPVGNTAQLSLIGAGKYILQITDASGCKTKDFEYFIANEDENLSSPKLNNVQLCAPGNVTFRINNFSPEPTYLLYETVNSSNNIGSFTNGSFSMEVTQSRSFYISQKIGSCESQKTEVKVVIGIADFDIPNTITPNNDQINDEWRIKSIENYPKAVVQIFNRSGVKVFESVGYKTPFNGTHNNKPLSTGVYYYFISFGSNCNPLKGSLTIIR